MELYERLVHPVAFSLFVVTLLLPVGVGFWTLRRNKNQADFFLGGRAMDRVMVALSAVSSGRSSWLVLGLIGMAYSKGVSAVWAVVGYVVVEMLQFVFLGRRLREQTEQYESITLLDYFESRLDDKNKRIRIVGSLIIAIFMTAYVAAQLKAGADSLKIALNISDIGALLISVVLIVVYMTLGGFIAVIYNDAIRAIIMLIGLVVLPVFGLIQVGGFGAMVEILTHQDPLLVDPVSLGVGALIGFLGIGLGSPGQPHIVVRYMAISDADKLRMASVVGTLSNVVLGWGAIFVGLLCRVIVPDRGALPDSNPEMAYLVLSAKFFGPAMVGLLMGGVFAAILSTADSQLLVVASTVVRDVYEKMFYHGESLSERKKLLLSRTVVSASGLLAALLAYWAKDLIFWLVLFAWGGLGASFGPAIIFSLYWNRTTKEGVLAGMITGTTIIMLWKLFIKESTGLYELIPAFFLSALVVFVVSLWSSSKKANQ